MNFLVLTYTVLKKNGTFNIKESVVVVGDSLPFVDIRPNTKTQHSYTAKISQSFGGLHFLDKKQNSNRIYSFFSHKGRRKSSQHFGQHFGQHFSQHVGTICYMPDNI